MTKIEHIAKLSDMPMDEIFEFSSQPSVFFIEGVLETHKKVALENYGYEVYYASCPEGYFGGNSGIFTWIDGGFIIEEDEERPY